MTAETLDLVLEGDVFVAEGGVAGFELLDMFLFAVAESALTSIGLAWLWFSASLWKEKDPTPLYFVLSSWSVEG